jgi:hypothetical protein|tara:strand:- start:2601 stop:2711 length:111 start_codon:yes stop_codon:yes gene_type:complete
MDTVEQKELDKSWKDWLKENLANGCAPACWITGGEG